jgi:hypothetical protein
MPIFGGPKLVVIVTIASKNVSSTRSRRARRSVFPPAPQRPPMSEKDQFNANHHHPGRH